MGVPPNHPRHVRIFHELNQPASLGIAHLWKPQMVIPSRYLT